MSHTSTPRGTVRRLFAGLLLALMVLLGAGVTASPPAVAEQSAPVTVTITSMDPISPSPTGTLTISGSVKNSSARAITGVQVHLWRSTDALADTSALDDVLASTPENPLGRRMVTAEEGNIFNITDVGTQKSQAVPAGKKSLAPGESVSFTVQGKVQGATGLGFDEGAYLTGVQVRGDLGEGDGYQTIGRSRALVVVAAGKSTQTTPQTLVLLNSAPSWVQGTTFRDSHLDGELRGRLGLLLRLARQDGTTLLVDPELVDELTAMSKGYSVKGAPAALATQGPADAKAYLAALTPLLSQGRAYRTLYGSPDVRRAVALARPDLVTRSATALPKTHPLAGLPLAVVPAGQVLDDQTASTLQSIHPDVVLAGNLESGAPVQSVDGLTVVRVAADAYDGGPRPSPSQSAPQVAGRLQVQQRLGDSVTTVASTSTEASAELATAVWRSRRTLPQLLQSRTSATGTLVTPTATTPDVAWLSGLDAAQDDLAAWGELVNRQSEAATLVSHVLPATLSTTWGTDIASANAWLTAVQAARGSVLSGDGVQLRLVQNFVTSASNQEIPVTITNGLADTVKVKVTFDSENSQRIDVVDTGTITVASGDSDTVKVLVKTHANGQVGVTARLATTTGRPIGSAKTLTITATQAGRVGWIIIIASGVVLLGGTAMRIRQVQHERRLSSGATQAAHLSRHDQ